MLAMTPPSRVAAAREAKAAARMAEMGGEGSLNLTTEIEVDTALKGRVRRDWHRNRPNKSIIEKRLLAALRARKGEYSPSKLAEIRAAGGSEIYVKLTMAKVRTAIAQMKSITMPAGGWSHGVKPTKEPSMPPWMAEEAALYLRDNPMFLDENGQPLDLDEQADNLEHMIRTQLAKKAKTAARRMEAKIHDVLQEGGWRNALSDFIDDLCTYQAAIMKGPYFVNTPLLKWEMNRDGVYVPVQTNEPRMQWRTIDPFDAYPAPGVDSVHKGSFIERMRLSRDELYSMKMTPDVYDVEAIDRLLEGESGERLDNWLWTDSERQRIADHTYFWYAQSTDYDALHWYGEAMGYELIEHGVSPGDIEDPNRPYQVDVILIGNEIIKATLNRDLLYRRNINSTCYEKTPGTIWGNAIADLMEDSAQMVNSSARALQNNMAHASGFQVEVDYTRLHPNTDPNDIYPFKIWQGKESEFSGDRPVARFFQPESNAAELIAVMQNFAAQADEDSGIPRMLSGGGSAEDSPATARATAMLKEDGAKILRSAVQNMDEDMISPTLGFVFDWLMLNDPDDSIKGDTQIVAKGMMAALQREGARQQHMAVLDLLGNPEDRALLGEDRRYAIIRNMLDTFEEIDTDELIPGEDEIRFKLEQMAKTPPPPDPKMIAIESNERQAMQKLEFERQKFAEEQAAKREEMALDLQKDAAQREVQVQVSRDDLDLKMQNEIVKLRAARHSAFEVGQNELMKEQMKIEAQARAQMEKLRADLALQRMAGGEKVSENTPQDAGEVEAAVTRILLPMLQDLRQETIEAIGNVAQLVTAEAGMAGPSGNINVAVNLPDCTPGTKKVTTSRDAAGNLQATISPESAE